MNALMGLLMLLTAQGEPLAYDAYGQMRTQQEGNLLISPVSLSTALAMTYAGADGETREEIAGVLHLPADLPDKELHAEMAELLTGLQYQEERAGNGLTIANRLWAQSDLEIEPEFLEITRENYGAELGQLDFSENPDNARQEINEWVEAQTADKIEELLPSGTLSESTLMVLVNTVYFHDQWEFPFAEDDTTEAEFQVSAEESVTVPLMYQFGVFDYADMGDFHVVEMPYHSNRDLSMLVLLPHDPAGLAELEDQFNEDSLADCVAALESRQMRLYLPRFRIEAELSLNELLSSLGMPSAFDASRADFSRINSERTLFISQVRHKTFIEVSEWGTEAAAATSVEFTESAPPPGGRVEFRADHPFLFVIRDNESGSLVFLGRVVNPNE